MAASACYFACFGFMLYVVGKRFLVKKWLTEFQNRLFLPKQQITVSFSNSTKAALSLF